MFTTKILKLACVAGFAVLAHSAQAKKPSAAGWTAADVQRIQFGEPQLAPMAHTFFCINYREDCETTGSAGREATATAVSFRQLADVNAQVNGRIAFERNNAGVAGEKWLLFPGRGDCNDYAVSKRHALLASGVPSQTLLLAEVVTTWGEHHLVLLVRRDEGDVVLDSLTDRILPWSDTPYRWVRIQSPDDPRFWLAADSRRRSPTLASNERRAPAQKRAAMPQDVSASAYPAGPVRSQNVTPRRPRPSPDFNSPGSATADAGRPADRLSAAQRFADGT